ncbi:hypothetical protein BH24GEM3_BH24GEM3_17130 [soil metagenome]
MPLHLISCRTAGWARRGRITLLVPLLALAILPPVLCAQAPLAPELWSASWIAHPEAPGDAYGVYHFRRAFELPARPERFLVHVSADNRYRLFVNGAAVAEGPARGDLMHWRYETVDLAPHLRPGRNLLAAVVWNWGVAKPVAQISHRTGFLLQAGSARDSMVNTGPGWKVLQNPAYSPIAFTYGDVDGYYASPPGEMLDARLYPWGWERPDHSDGGWAAARTVQRSQARGVSQYGEAGGWQLVPRPIPPMEETLQRIPRVARAEGVRASDAFLRGAGDLVVPPRTRAVILLDQTYLTNAYLVVEASGGAGGTLKLIYAEALQDPEGQKGHRNEIAGKTIKGIRDSLTFDGGARRRFRTLWFRTFRYLQLEVQTADEPLRIHDVHGVFTAYPFQERGRFASDLPWLQRMWEINWRVARLDAWETYFDTPYYEQLQYIGDTRIQSLLSLYMAGDDRLMRNALMQFDESRIPEGITASRYPSNLPQYIPPFSLFWVAMVHDYWMHRDDPAFVRSFLPGVRGVLAWFERHLDGTGMLGPMPWWNFGDWAEAYPRGVPPGADDGHSALITLQFAYALRRAAELEAGLGEPALGVRYRALADAAVAAVQALAWDPARGLFADSPERGLYSQQTNVLAVLAGAVPIAEQAALMHRVLADSSLVPASYYFLFYVHEALREAGLADRYLEQLGPWQEMLALGLTTTPETPEPTRSDSHAWSAHPNYGLLATVLGVRSAEPGFRSVRIAPALGALRRAEGRVPHPLGDIEVRLTRLGVRGLRAEITLPPGLGGVFEWRGRQIPLREGRQQFRL